MNLAEFEQRLVESIYDILVNSDDNESINLFGESGCGKTTIALNVAEELQEGWSVFYLEGLDANLSPYLTWHIGTKIFSKKKLNLGGEISFGVSFPPTPISLEVGASFQPKVTNYVLSVNEEILVESIKKQAGANTNILFIADNFEQWDIPSKHFLQKIMLPQLNILDGFHIDIIIITREKICQNNLNVARFLSVPRLSDESMIFILRQQGYFDRIKIDDIRLCAGNNMSLAIMAAEYYSNHSKKAIDINEIIDRRFKDLPSDVYDACKILEPLSIIDSFITKDIVAYFIKTPQIDSIEIEYLAEEYLLTAEDQQFISGEENFCFTTERIRAYFKSKLDKRERYYHRIFAQYLQKKHPEDYFNRGKHLFQSMQIYDTAIMIESWQLFFISYIRRSNDIGCLEDIYNILDEINSIIDKLPHDLAETHHIVLNELLNGYQEINKYNYKKALIHFQAITPSRLITACLAECQRLILLCHLQLAENEKAIIQAAEDLYTTIKPQNLFEDEQFCRAALILLDVYIDRHNDPNRVNILKNRFIRTIQNHFGCSSFEEFEASFNRKSSLYYTAAVAFRQTFQSVCYYKNHYNRNNLYMSLCNHAGNSLIYGDYDSARCALNECQEMMGNNEGWYYPSQYKVHNNTILLNYLVAEKEAADCYSKIIDAAEKAASELFDLLDCQYDEVSHVVLLNYISFSILCNKNNWLQELKQAYNTLFEIDNYYQYYLHDLMLAAYLLNNETENAKQEILFLEQLDVPLLKHYRPILKVRRNTQEKLIENCEMIKENPVAYNTCMFKACNHIQDPSCKFFGRGFLLSDLQFLSF